jgi:hypothetical protein
MTYNYKLDTASSHRCCPLSGHTKHGAIVILELVDTRETWECAAEQPASCSPVSSSE